MEVVTTKGRAAGGRCVAVMAIGLISAVMVHWVVAVACAPIGPDAGYYAAMARHLQRGDGVHPGTPFATPYPPGVFYLLSVLGSERLREPV
ncbi:MAG: hypothetical protein ONB06_09555, partial [candidate division KSB1 bacterium]|nr:hypothetical protein [candidate division KSB1 bacterium]